MLSDGWMHLPAELVGGPDHLSFT